MAFGAYIRHLRFPFQLGLSPLFLWGALLGGGGVTAGTIAAFVSLHLFLYPALTAFNSAYDRDEGPVSGMLKPPPVPEGLLRFSLVLAATGAMLVASAGWQLLLIYLTILLLGTAYSHPRTRWKARPWISAAAVAIGQGTLGLLAGWAAVAPLDFSSTVMLAGGVGAALSTLAVYPVTQLFQVEEDARRGDRTIAIALGRAGAARFGALCLLLAALPMVWLTTARFGRMDGAVLATGYAAALLYLLWFSWRLARGEGEQTSVYSRAMRLHAAIAAGFIAFVAWQAINLT